MFTVTFHQLMMTCWVSLAILLILLAGGDFTGGDRVHLDQDLDQDDDVTILFQANRYLGYRRIDDVTEESDYAFELQSDGRWMYRPQKTGLEIRGQLGVHWPEIKQGVQRWLDGDLLQTWARPGPQVPDLPLMTLRVPQDDGLQGFEMQVDAPAAVSFHFYIQQWRDGWNVIPWRDDPVLPIRVEQPDELRQAFADEGPFGTPVELASSQALSSAIPSSEIQDAIEEQVDFERHKILVFSWSGSSRDQLSYRIERSATAPPRGPTRGQVQFVYQPGRTRDLRRHVELFAIDRDATYTLDKPEH